MIDQNLFVATHNGKLPAIAAFSPNLGMRTQGLEQEKPGWQ